jgi:hypothetical protein
MLDEKRCGQMSFSGGQNGNGGILGEKRKKSLAGG